MTAHLTVSRQKLAGGLFLLAPSLRVDRAVSSAHEGKGNMMFPLSRWTACDESGRFRHTGLWGLPRTGLPRRTESQNPQRPRPPVIQCAIPPVWYPGESVQSLRGPIETDARISCSVLYRSTRLAHGGERLVFVRPRCA